VDCDTGEMAEETLFADMTICMEAVKQGLMKEPAFAACGEIYTVPLGLPDEADPLKAEKIVVDDAWVEDHSLYRSEFGHKGTFGKVMVIGGSTNYFGAPVLAGMAAYRTGCGLVNLAVPHAVTTVMASKVPEFTWLSLEDEDGVIAESAAELVLKKVNEYNCLALGPGIGLEETTAHFLQRLLLQPDNNNRRKVGFLEGENPNSMPVELPAFVIDADALRWLANQENWYEKIQAHMVLTPHPGEMAALTGIPVKKIQQDRQNVASHYAQTWHQVVVLKGALTVIAAPDGRIAVIPIASSALSKAGSGDVLTGILASLIAQGQPLYEAAVLAAWIHANSGLNAAKVVGCEASVLASDIIESIPMVLADLENEE
jgi:ADP-dependent NAD(P)H-hydrate dehydratase / NAD(P)H-hydrate epimerase